MRDVFEEMERIRQEMKPILGEIFRGRQMLLPLQQPGKCSAKCVPAGWVPARNALADIKETETNIIAAFEMPGVDKKDIEVNVNEGSIEVKAFRQTECHEKKGSPEKGCEKSCESRSIRFYRILQLPAKVNPDKATATCKDGILRVEMPKTKSEAKKRVEIR